jgi:hypothetical protein
LAQDPNNPSILYASGSQVVGSSYIFSVAKSNDGGATWPTRGTFKTIYYGDDCRIKVAPWNSTQVYAAATYRDQNYNPHHEVFSSSNVSYWSNITYNLASLFDSEYSTIYSLYLSPDQMIYLATSSGLMCMRAGTSTWSKSELAGTVFDLAYDPVTHALFAGTANGLFYTTDGDAHWEPLGKSDLMCTSLDMDVANELLYVGTAGESIYQVQVGQLYAGASPMWVEY